MQAGPVREGCIDPRRRIVEAAARRSSQSYRQCANLLGVAELDVDPFEPSPAIDEDVVGPVDDHVADLWVGKDGGQGPGTHKIVVQPSGEPQDGVGPQHDPGVANRPGDRCRARCLAGGDESSAYLVEQSFGHRPARPDRRCWPVARSDSTNRAARRRPRPTLASRP